ncbi:AsmA family protein [Jannaschia rubra]|uniref:Putative assembly protein n=1 Tax=Jannaschia rubra TaxID=282197 RepID=A0A0M6XSL8_9RHOB|nr:AsmA family protein [Jannaschia rubra]CTQ33788.1 putative assembly protein [Jannaschia rubra]SFG09060.1 AsmA protein [Jannaschia rubra]
MKWLIRTALTLTMVLALAVAVLLLIPAERIAGLAADRFETATGRKLSIAGPVKATLWPRIGVRAEGIVVANADWSDEGPMLTADTLEVGIAASSMFGDLAIRTLEVTGARLILEKRSDGTGNWTFGAPSRPGAAPGSGTTRTRDVAVDRAVLTGAEITWIDHAAGTNLRMRAVDLETRLSDLDSPVTVDASALVNGEALTARLSAVALRPLIDGALTPVTLDLTGGASSLRVEGRADRDPPSFEGRIEGETTDRFALLRAAGIAVPDLPEGLGARRMEIDAAATLAPAGTLHLRDMVLDLDGNRLTGAIDVDPSGARPRVTATLAAETLNLTGLSRQGQGGETALVSETGWGREEIDVSGLFAADGDVTFASGPIRMGDVTLDDLRARVAVENGRAVVTLQPLIAYGGTVTGDVVVNGRGGLSTRARLDMSGLQLQPLLTGFADFDRFVGRADLAVDLLGAGDTAQALVESLAGTIDLRVGEGAILGLDIVGMVRTLDLGYRGEGQKTVFDDLAASFVVTDGVARNDDLSLTAPYLTATGAGDVDLGAQTISYRLMPTLRADRDGKGVTVPISVEGTWSDPRVRPDLEYLARQRMEIERAELEARARAEADEARARTERIARDRLAQELEVPAETLDSREAIEDAILDRVEDQLLDLLTGR